MRSEYIHRDEERKKPPIGGRFDEIGIRRVAGPVSDHVDSLIIIAVTPEDAAIGPYRDESVRLVINGLEARFTTEEWQELIGFGSLACRATASYGLKFTYRKEREEESSG